MSPDAGHCSPPFSAVILAGGRSTRMGRDKAFLEVHGQPLLARQIGLVRSLGPAEVFVSGRANTDYSGFGCPVLRDPVPDAGPLAGIAAALDAARAPLVLVLAVDLPCLTREGVASVLAACEPARGAVPRVAGRWEPLVAVYPRSAAALAGAQLAQRRFAAGEFARRCERAGLVRWLDLPPEWAGAFANWNSPADLSPGSAPPRSAS